GPLSARSARADAGSHPDGTSRTCRPHTATRRATPGCRGGLSRNGGPNALWHTLRTTMKRLALLLMFICALALLGTVHAQAPAQLDRLQRADGALVLPDKFLRSWDPITIFFDHDQGPANGGPEDAPERIVSMQPAVPGAWQWLGPRTLQFRPADAWK